MTMNTLSSLPSLWETSCYATLTFRAHLQFDLIYFCKYTQYVSRSSRARSPGGYRRTMSLLFAASSLPQLSCQSQCRHVGADSLEMETRGKGGQGFVTVALTLTNDNCPVTASLTPQGRVLTLSQWRGLQGVQVKKLLLSLIVTRR